MPAPATSRTGDAFQSAPWPSLCAWHRNARGALREMRGLGLPVTGQAGASFIPGKQAFAVPGGRRRRCAETARGREAYADANRFPDRTSRSAPPSGMPSFGGGQSIKSCDPRTVAPARGHTVSEVATGTERGACAWKALRPDLTGITCRAWTDLRAGQHHSRGGSQTRQKPAHAHRGLDRDVRSPARQLS